MDRQEINGLEEKLREAACIGDFDAIVTLIKEGVNPNAQHLINGWTPLHWAAKRGQTDIVKYLLDNGAKKSILTKKGETPLTLASRPDVRIALGGEPGVTVTTDSLPITPHYLKYAPIDANVDLHQRNSNVESVQVKNHSSSTSTDKVYNQNDELVLKVRIASSGDNDFIEIELPRMELTYYSLLKVCCEELGLVTNQVSRIRKLPNTLVRKDKDVQRLKDFQELELVINSAASESVSKLIPGMNSLFGSNNYQSISRSKNQTILY